MKLNTNLENEFNLAPMVKEELTKEETSIEVINNYKESLDKVDNALKQVYGLDNCDDEFDKIHDIALSAFQDMLDLSMNVEQRLSSEIGAVANSFLVTALNSRVNKAKSKLDRVALQIKKQLADIRAKEAGLNNPNNAIPLEGESQLLDRNQILQELLNSSKKDK